MRPERSGAREGGRPEWRTYEFFQQEEPEENHLYHCNRFGAGDGTRTVVVDDALIENR